MSKRTWKEILVEKVSNAFNRHFWKLIILLIIVVFSMTAWTFKRDKNGTITIDTKPAFKEIIK